MTVEPTKIQITITDDRLHYEGAERIEVDMSLKLASAMGQADALNALVVQVRPAIDEVLMRLLLRKGYGKDDAEDKAEIPPPEKDQDCVDEDGGDIPY